MNIDALRRRLLLSIAGTFATGCGTTAPDGGDGSDEGSQVESSDGTTGTTSSDSLSASSAPPTGTSSSGSDGSGNEDTMRVDAGMTHDVPLDVPPGCPPQPEPPTEACVAELPSTDAYFLFYCVDLSSGLSCEKWSSNAADPDFTWPITECNDHDCTGPYVIDIGCGPLPDLGDQCCFWFMVEDTQTCPGRPFVVAGRERLAELTGRDDWRADVVLTTKASAHRAAIAAAWAEQAAFEHASIASFSRFILQLLACGAPARLLAKAQLALGEEIEHARLFFGFASHYAGRALGPAALATHDALAGTHDFDAIVLSAVREGCIAETISAWHVTIAAQSARDPAMARALARVAEQELEHAALAWEFLAWALPHASDSLRRRIEAALHDAARFAPRGPMLATTVGSAEWLAHGILPAAEHAAATRHALHELVVPVARSLMNAVPTASEAPTALHRAST